MVKLRIAKTKAQEHAQGIHILNPTQMEIENAKGDADAKGFKTIWIHKKKIRTCDKCGRKTTDYFKNGDEILCYECEDFDTHRR